MIKKINDLLDRFHRWVWWETQTFTVTKVEGNVLTLGGAPAAGAVVSITYQWSSSGGGVRIPIGTLVSATRLSRFARIVYRMGAAWKANWFFSPPQFVGKLPERTDVDCTAGKHG